MPYAEVSVNSPIARGRTFSYNIPPGLTLVSGQAVYVPFGPKILQGIVVSFSDTPAVEKTRDITGIIDTRPLVSPVHLALASWMSEYYQAPLFNCIALMLPPLFERSVITYFRRLPGNPPDNPEWQEFLDGFSDDERLTQKQLEEKFGVRKTAMIVRVLLKSKLLERSFELQKERIKPRLISVYQAALSGEEVARILEGRLSAKQQALLTHLSHNPAPSTAAELKQAGFAASVIKTALKKGWLQEEKRQVDRDPLAGTSVNLSFPPALSPAQETAFNQIKQSLHNNTGGGTSKPFLLYGVTGSGKTEVYLRALEETVKMGKKGIVLAPEIAMTPQLIERFVSRFPGRVAVLHSRLSPGEQFDEWWRIKSGEFDVVIGPRSALFAPQPDLGLIILDEEHEWSYKQDSVPCYHARTAARKLAELSGATLVLGSATPDVDSFYLAGRSEYTLLELPDRSAAGTGAVLPVVQIIDLREELKAGNTSVFSRPLQQAISVALAEKQQVILFLNRRGGATFIECRRCGYVVRCRRCDNTLSYHFDEEKLVCHRCDYRAAVPEICPVCRSRQIKFLGLGTERLEYETARAFPQAGIIRWDSDVTRNRGRSHQAIFEKFRSGAADILIGTQMIAKGLDLPRVTVVGVVSADVSLNLPDFRAGERTFQLLSQVAGRAGRGSAAGQVFIQTYTPAHYAIQAAARHDYPALYQKEMEFRRELRYPPFSRLARLTFAHKNAAFCQQEAWRLKKELENVIVSQGLAGLSLIGPAPAFEPRLRGAYRWQMTVRAADPAAFLSGRDIPQGWQIDIDPLGL